MPSKDARPKTRARAEAARKPGGDRDEEVIRVVVVGLGAIGRTVASCAARHPELQIVAAADPRHAGVSLSSLAAGAPEVIVEKSSSLAYRKAKGGVVLLCTVSRLDEVLPQIEEAVEAGFHVVSSCEELVFPAFTDPEAAARIDRAARRAGVSVLGTGVNPGFVLDRLVATLASGCGEIQHVEAGRIVDARTRREALQRKVGAGLSVAEFERRADEGSLGHIGLSESCAVLAEGLALSIDEVEEEIDPVIAERPVEGAIAVPAGAVRGVHQEARAFDGGREVIRLVLEISLGAKDPRDWAAIDADPPVRMVLPGGAPGDRATAWSLLNAVPRVVAAEGGLLSVMDLPAGR